MPIYQGTSTKNKSEIIINGTPMSKVYVGDRLVWQKPSGVYPVEYGLLYNWYAATDTRKITSSDDWVVPDISQFTILINYTGGSSIAGKHLKHPEFWNSGGLNSFNFNLKSTAERQGYDGEFLGGFGMTTNLWTLTTYLTYVRNLYVEDPSDFAGFGYFGDKKSGNPIRLLYTGIDTPTSYTGNDGKVYRVVTIGTQTWLADNLAETKFRNGDIIPWHGANPANYFTNVEWAALTTAGCCAYNNDVNNVASGFTFPI